MTQTTDINGGFCGQLREYIEKAAYTYCQNRVALFVYSMTSSVSTNDKTLMFVMYINKLIRYL